MARKRRQRIAGLIPQLGHGLRIIERWIVTHPQPFLALGLLGVAAWGFCAYGRHSEAFRITAVILPEQDSLKVPDAVLNANLWDVDIQRLSEDLKRQRPWLKDVQVVRRLPDRLQIRLIERIPVARVRLDRWYPVDREGFILPDRRAELPAKLIRLTGVGRSVAGLKVGRENTDDQLKLALRVLETLQRAPAPIAHRIREVNVADAQQIRLMLDLAAAPVTFAQSIGATPHPAETGQETEVRCGSEAELGMHLERLRAVLKVIAKQQEPIRYIDVRFPEPVIGPRT